MKKKINLWLEDELLREFKILSTIRSSNMTEQLINFIKNEIELSKKEKNK